MSAAFKIDPKIQQRRVPRRAFAGAVGVLAGGYYDLERAASVGEGGMKVSTERALEVGNEIVLNFNLEGALIIVRAVVRSFHPSRTTANGREPAQVGVEFLNLGFQHKRAIRNFVAQATESSL